MQFPFGSNITNVSERKLISQNQNLNSAMNSVRNSFVQLAPLQPLTTDIKGSFRQDSLLKENKEMSSKYKYMSMQELAKLEENQELDKSV